MEQLACDRCRKSPAHRVEVSVALWNVVQADHPTATIVGADACVNCQADVIETLSSHATEMLREQIPIHREMMKASLDRDGAQGKFTALGPTLRAFADAGAEVPKGIATERDAVLALIADAEDRRIKIALHGTEVQDAATAKLVAALKKK